MSPAAKAWMSGEACLLVLGYGMLARNAQSPAGRVYRRSPAGDCTFLASGGRRRLSKLEEFEGEGWRRGWGSSYE